MISVISFTAIALAVAALIITMSIMNGFRAELTGKILGFNGHVHIVGGAVTPSERDAAVRRLRMTPGVVQAVPVVESQVLVQGPAATSGAVVRGVAPVDLAATKIIAGNIKSGSLAGFADGSGEAVLVGQRLAESLGIKAGDPISLLSPTSNATVLGDLPERKTYAVAGTFSVGMSDYDQSFIYMPLAEAQAFFGRGEAVDSIDIKLADPDQARAMKPKLAAMVGPGAVGVDWTEQNRAYFNALQVERNVMRFIFLFIVALAAMNIISGLIMLVKNKSRDIAILRTMGAGRGAVLRIFFMAGATIGLVGTLAGLAAGILFCANIEAIQSFVEWVTGVQVFNADIYFLAHVPAKIDWAEVAGVTVWTLAAACLFTLPPAMRAARLDPVEALRFE